MMYYYMTYERISRIDEVAGKSGIYILEAKARGPEANRQTQVYSDTAQP